MNVFLNGEDKDTNTALLLSKAIVHDIGNAVAYTDGTKIFINTEDNLYDILPAYNNKMLKWLLWHEKMHIELKHHNRYFKYLSEITDIECKSSLNNLTKAEVNTIMDILVHDSMTKMFPDLIETALLNLAQFRNRNSLKYTFKTFTLEEMLDEYSKYKHEEGEDKKEGAGEGEGETEEDKEEEENDSKGNGNSTKTKDTKETDKPKEDKDKKTKGSTKKSHAEGGHDSAPREKSGKDKSEITSEAESEQPAADSGHHDETDWSKLENIDSKEFITEEESEEIQSTIQELRNQKIRLARLTETLNGLVTSTRKRSYIMPSTIHVGNNVLLKGSTPSKAKLYLVFDASGSMQSQMDLFKEIISKSIPQAMDSPCEWFAGYSYDSKIKPYKMERENGYYKGNFKDFMPVRANRGYNDDGDRTIELCYKAEQQGYTPIGVTDGGGRLTWSKDKLKQLKRTILVCNGKNWINEVKKVNPNIQIIYIDI